MTMSDAVRAEYERVLARVIIKRGSVVVQTDGWYGWVDYDATTHVSKCGVATHGAPDEDTWYEFKGTFYEGDTSVHGMALSGVTCKCGRITDRSLRWQASVVEVATEVFAEAYSKCGTRHT